MAVSFIPFIMETLGGSSKQAVDTVQYWPFCMSETEHSSFRVHSPPPYGEVMLLSGFTATFRNSQEMMAFKLVCVLNIYSVVAEP